MDKDKLIFDDILIEIDNLKKYNNELANNVRGDELENYINKVNSNIHNYENNIEKIYEENFDNTETLE